MDDNTNATSTSTEPNDARSGRVTKHMKTVLVLSTLGAIAAVAIVFGIFYV